MNEVRDKIVTLQNELNMINYYVDELDIAMRKIKGQRDSLLAMLEWALYAGRFAGAPPNEGLEAHQGWEACRKIINEVRNKE